MLQSQQVNRLNPQLKSITNEKTKKTYWYYVQNYLQKQNKQGTCRKQTTLHLIKDHEKSHILKIVRQSNKAKLKQGNQTATINSSELKIEQNKQNNIAEQNTEQQKLTTDIYDQIYGKDSPLHGIEPKQYTQSQVQFRGYMLAMLLINPLNIQNFIKIYDVFMEQTITYVVMQFVQSGFNLQDPYQRKKLSFTQIYKYYSQLLTVISTFKKINPRFYEKSDVFIHRDFKLKNLVINKQMILKIIDFGNCKVGNESSQKTRSSTYKYQPYQYMNAKKGDKLNHLNIDLWSITIVLYQLIFLCFPHDIYVEKKQQIKQWTKLLQETSFSKYKHKMLNCKGSNYPPIFDEIFENVFVPTDSRSLQKIQNIVNDKTRWKQAINQFQRKQKRIQMFYYGVYSFHNQIIYLLNEIFDYFSQYNKHNKVRLRLVQYYIHNLIRFIYLRKYKFYDGNRQLQITSEQTCFKFLYDNSFNHQVREICKQLFVSDHSDNNYRIIQQLRCQSSIRIKQKINRSRQLGKQLRDTTQIKTKSFKQIRKSIKKIEQQYQLPKTVELKNFRQQIQNLYDSLLAINDLKIDESSAQEEYHFNKGLQKFISVKNILFSDQRKKLQLFLKEQIIKSYEVNNLNAKFMKTKVNEFLTKWLYKILGVQYQVSGMDDGNSNQILESQWQLRKLITKINLGKID